MKYNFSKIKEVNFIFACEWDQISYGSSKGGYFTEKFYPNWSPDRSMKAFFMQTKYVEEEMLGIHVKA